MIFRLEPGKLYKLKRNDLFRDEGTRELESMEKGIILMYLKYTFYTKPSPVDRMYKYHWFLDSSGKIKIYEFAVKAGSNDDTDPYTVFNENYYSNLNISQYLQNCFELIVI